MITAATVCSGIGAPEVAMPHWRYSFQSEIEAFPRAVLMQRHGAQDARHTRKAGPALWGDFTCIRVRFLRRLGIELPQWLIAGTPCQAFSLAGLRNSLADARGNLTLEFVRLVHSIRRAGTLRGFTWENVPGILTSADNAFGCFLAAIVGADDALLPCERPAPGRSNALWRWVPAGRWPVLDDEGEETGEYVEREAAHIPKWPDAGMVAGPWARLAWRVFDAQYFGLAQRRRRVFVVASFGNGPDPAEILFERQGMHGNHPPSRGEGEGFTHPVAPSLTGSGRGVERPGESRGQDPVVAVHDCPAKQPARPAAVAPTLNAHFGDKLGLEDQHINGGAGLFVPALANSLRAEGCDASEDGTGRTTLVPVCFSAKDHGADAMEDCSPTLRAGGHSGSHANAGVMPAVAFMENQRGELRTSEVVNLTGGGGKPGQGYPATMQGAGVRRLIPRECERLQGFPDDFTAITYRRKPAADGPRYKSLGNSMPVPVLRWIGQRIEAAWVQNAQSAAA